MFSKRSVSRAAVILSFLPFPAFAAAAAAAKPPAPAAKDQIFAEAIDVSVVSLDVIVSDRNGKPVTGLTAADFTVLEDGKPAEITNFYAESGAPGAAAPTAATAPAAERGAKPATVPPEQRLSFAIFVDNRNILPPARNRIIQSIKRFLAAHPLTASDNVMVASYDGAVEIRQQPTHDGAVLNAALDAVTKGSSRGVERTVDQRLLLSELQQAPLPPPPPPANDMSAPLHPDDSQARADELYAHIHSYAETRYMETRTTLLALGQFVDSLSGLPGRKALLYVTGGLSLRPGEALFNAYQAKYAAVTNSGGAVLRGASATDSHQLDATQDFDRLIERANANRVTFYTLGAPEDVSGTNAQNGGDNAAWQDQSSTEAFNVASPLNHLAFATGGVAAIDAVDPGGMLDRMHLDFESYYSLGYTSRFRDAKSHKVAVQVRDKSLKVRNREGFRYRTGDESTTDRLTAALLLGTAENPFGVSLDFGPETRDKKGETKVEVTVKFPLSSLVLLPQENFHDGHVMLFLAARDSHGRTSQITRVAVPIHIPDAQLERALHQTAGYRTTLPLRDEEHTLAVAVRDELGNADSTLQVHYTPGQHGAAAPAAKADH